jgi:(heptosyl)LPS beta-1,4-glucosyltransferase
MTSKVSIIIRAKDEEMFIDQTLKAIFEQQLAFEYEVIVIDSGSTDRSRTIASEFGAIWHEHPFDDYGAQKIRATELATNDWILALDADEVLDQAAIRAIETVDWTHANPKMCWRIRRRPFIGSCEVRHGHWVPDRIIRLFNRRYHNFCNHPVHATVKPSSTVTDLDGSIEHYCYEDMADVFRTDYHRLKAAHYKKNGRTASGPVLAARAYWAFSYSYFIRRGFLDGRIGVITAAAGALNAILGLALASEKESTTNPRS